MKSIVFLSFFPWIVCPRNETKRDETRKKKKRRSKEKKFDFHLLLLLLNIQTREREREKNESARKEKETVMHAVFVLPARFFFAYVCIFFLLGLERKKKVKEKREEERILESNRMSMRMLVDEDDGGENERKNAHESFVNGLKEKKIKKKRINQRNCSQLCREKNTNRRDADGSHNPGGNNEQRKNVTIETIMKKCIVFRVC